MLTFFEYLRQRAYESVIQGAQEALEYLEREKSIAAKKRQERLLSSASGDVQESEVDSAELTVPESLTGNDQGSEEKVRPPRRRGRPRQEKGTS